MLVAALVAALATAPAANSAAPPAEVTAPAGAPTGIVVALHGGGWLSAEDLGETTVSGLMKPWVKRLTRAGALVVNVDYRSGAKSLRDSLAAFDWAAREWPDLPICTLGFSAGGHLALAVDLRGRHVACGVSIGGPLNLRKASPEVVRMAAAFFKGRLRELSPALHPDRIGPRTLLVGATCDTKVPYAYQRDAARALDARFVSVAAGDGGRPLHCATDRRSYREAMAKQVSFVTHCLERARPHG